MILTRALLGHPCPFPVSWQEARGEHLLVLREMSLTIWEEGSEKDVWESRGEQEPTVTVTDTFSSLHIYFCLLGA